MELLVFLQNDRGAAVAIFILPPVILVVLWLCLLSIKRTNTAKRTVVNCLADLKQLISRDENSNEAKANKSAPLAKKFHFLFLFTLLLSLLILLWTIYICLNCSLVFNHYLSIIYNFYLFICSIHTTLYHFSPYFLSLVIIFVNPNMFIAYFYLTH